MGIVQNGYRKIFETIDNQFFYDIMKSTQMRLYELRKKRGLTQQAVADAIVCSVNNYSRYERGVREPDIETLKRLSKYFDESIDYIVGND